MLLSYMSLATFKKKSIAQYGTRHSAKTGGHWLPQGPFGKPGSLTSVMLIDSINHIGSSGFSLNGSHRSISVGQEMMFSKQGTKFKGIHPVGYGGKGQYVRSSPLLNVSDTKIIVRGTQFKYIKPSVLSTKGMIAQKYRWINGQYPNVWVQPTYTGNQTGSSSQETHIQTLSAAADCHVDTNGEAKYVDYINVCNTNKAKQLFAPYTKSIHMPLLSSQHTLHIQRKCTNPIGPQKPFPYAVQTGSGSCFIDRQVELVPPDWYIN